MVTSTELRAVPLFADLSAEQITWVAGLAQEERFETGEFVYRRGDEDVSFFIVLDGVLQATKPMGSADTIIGTLEAGSFSGEIPLLSGNAYPTSLRALAPSRLLRFSPDVFQQLLANLPGVTTTVLREVVDRLKNVMMLWNQHERLTALGTIAAGLAHELNNPAAAIRRAADQLSANEALSRSAVQQLCAVEIPAGALSALGGLAPVTAPPALDPVALSDEEERLALWLEDLAIEEAWDLAPTLAASGVSRAALEPVLTALPAPGRAAALRWFTASLQTAELAKEIDESATRISDLVRSVKLYSYVDQAPSQSVNIHDGLDSTLKLLSHDLNGIEVVRDYDEELPRIEAYGSELNQVWTNLIDNAADAMRPRGTGRLHIRTSRELDSILVEIADNGPGIAPNVVGHIFEPFFTTKGVGEGSGLGLDISYRIVVDRHGGSLRVDSTPGDTRFQVRLPLAGIPARV